MSDKKEDIHSKDNEVKVFEDEKHILLDHNYDGIRELNHPLPGWWVATFILTIVFAIPYYLGHTFFGAESINQELAKDMKEITDIQQKHSDDQGGFDIEKYKAYIVTAGAAKSGKKTYKRKCKACHGASGEGGIGPNLTDKFWLHGDGSEATVFETINKGVPDKGMQAWGQALGEEKMFAVLKYVLDFQGTTPGNAKAPQGIEYP